VSALLALVLSAPGTGLRGQEAKKIPIIVRMSDVSINKVPFLVALDQGLYAKNGLDVTMIPFSASAATVHGLPEKVSEDIRKLGAKAQFSVGGGAPGMVSKARRSEPSDQVIIATTDHIVHWDIVAQKGIEKLEDLKGKRIAISSIEACTGTVGLILAERMGWDPEQDVAFLEGDYSVRPLQKGWADALIAYEVPLAMARKAGYRPMNINMRSWNEPIPCNGVWTSKAWAHANRDTVIRFLKSLVEAISMMKADKRVAFKSIDTWYTIGDSELQGIIYAGSAEMPQKPYPAVEGIKRAMKLYDSAAMRRFKPEDFYDDSFMKEIDQSGFIDALYRGR
jgi:ABC-type nitrate/sulfonate/bicarbonate transport system substrate-binding protein